MAIVCNIKRVSFEQFKAAKSVSSVLGLHVALSLHPRLSLSLCVCVCSVWWAFHIPMHSFHKAELSLSLTVFLVPCSPVRERVCEAQVGPGRV